MSAQLRLDGSMIARRVRRMFDQRQEPRAAAGIVGVLGWRGTPLAVKVLNLSNSGAMVTCDQIPHIGEAVTLQLADRESLQAVVRWVRDGRIGLHFATPLK